MRQGETYRDGEGRRREKCKSRATESNDVNSVGTKGSTNMDENVERTFFRRREEQQEI